MSLLPLTRVKTTTTLPDERAAVFHTALLVSHSRLIDNPLALSCFMCLTARRLPFNTLVQLCSVCEAEPVTKPVLPSDEMGKQLQRCVTARELLEFSMA